MKAIATSASALFLGILLTGCVTPTGNLAHSSLASSGEMKPASGKALVVFIRPSVLGLLIHASVHDGDKLIGMVPYNCMLAYQADPGKHTFMVVSEAADFMTVDLEAGKTYYAQVVPRMGAWRARFSLWPVKRAELDTQKVKKWIASAKGVENKPSAYEWEKVSQSSIMEKKEAYYRKWLTKSDADRPHLSATDGI